MIPICHIVLGQYSIDINIEGPGHVVKLRPDPGMLSLPLKIESESDVNIDPALPNRCYSLLYYWYYQSLAPNNLNITVIHA